MKTKLFLSAALACVMAAPATTQAGPLADATSDMLWGIEISGYLDVGSTYAFSRPHGAQRNILGFARSDAISWTNHRAFNDDEGSLIDFHAFQLSIDRLPEDIDEVGFRIDMMYGEDAQLVGGGSGVLDSGHFNMYQAYISYVAPLGNGLTIDAGRFGTWHGYEVIESPLNDNYSRSLLFGLSQPFTHTGFRATYTIDEMWEVSGGVTQGWDTVENNNDSYTGHFALRFMPMENVYIQNSVAYGAEEDGNNSDKTLLYDLVATWQATDQLMVGLNFDWAFAEKSPDNPRYDNSFSDAEWWGLAGYLRYDVTDKLYVALRGEYVEDRHNEIFDAFLPAGQNKVDVWETTLTVGYEVVDGLLTRVEYRHDDANEDIFISKDRLRSSQDTISWEIIYSF